MQLPKLSPLQSRFAASLVASIILLFLYLTLTKPSFAYAVELDSRIPSDHNHPITLDDDDDDDNYLPVDTDILDERSVHEQRQATPAAASTLENNAPQNKNINAGAFQQWVFTKDAMSVPSGQQGSGLPSRAHVETETELKHELRKRQSEVNIYITINVCEQPHSTSSNPFTRDEPPPQLDMSASPSSTTQGDVVSVEGGYAKIEMSAGGDVFVNVRAPNTTEFEGSWNYEIAASIDAPFHDVSDDANLLFVDGDNHAALLVTPDLTDAMSNETVYQDWMALKPPYGMFAHNQRNRSILGVSRSYCGLLHNAKVVANLEGIENLNTADMTNRGLNSKPKEQFYINPLEPSSTYWGFLAMQGNSTASGLGVVGGGGKVWAAMNFTTKASSNCALMYNLTFCSEVAYAVPTNPDKFNPQTGIPDLAAAYDSYAKQMYNYFNYSLQQIPCNTTASAQYSLVRNCDDCARAYKQWLCAVSIPRCEDWDNPASWLMQRNIAQKFVNGTTPPWVNDPSFQQVMDSTATNSSRNSIIDTSIQPGPYKEVLPCADLCYDLVQSCPAVFGFGCPTGALMNMSYGYRSSDPGIISCSYLGAAYYLSGSTRLSAIQSSLMMVLSVGLGMVLAFA